MMKAMFFSAEEASRYFSRQASLTHQIRRDLYRKAGISRMKSILDAGCGTGEITSEIREITGGCVTGVDIDEDFIEYARSRYKNLDFLCSDCASLPFDEGAFDMVIFHFFLMWVRKPQRVLKEIARVLKPGGVILACAELDYGGIIEYPQNPDFRKAEEEALVLRGADTRMGRKLGFVLRNAGLSVRHGIYSSVIQGDELMENIEFMKDIYFRDFTLLMDEKKARRLIDSEMKLARQGKMIVTPVFWALARKVGA